MRREEGIGFATAYREFKNKLHLFNNSPEKERLFGTRDQTTASRIISSAFDAEALRVDLKNGYVWARSNGMEIELNLPHFEHQGSGERRSDLVSHPIVYLLNKKNRPAGLLKDQDGKLEIYEISHNNFDPSKMRSVIHIDEKELTRLASGKEENIPESTIVSEERDRDPGQSGIQRKKKEHIR